MALISDLQAAIRALTASRGFSLIAIVTLAVGLALAVASVAIVNAYVLRGLPYPESDRLYRVAYSVPGQLPPAGLERLDWPSLRDIVEFQVAWDLDVFYLLGDDYPESAPGAWVTPGYIHALGVRAVHGRVFTDEDFAAGSAPVALISHRLWQSRFGGEADVLGRVFHAYVSDRPEEPESFTIVGVLPEGLWHLNAYSEVLVPLTAPAYPYMVRLRAGVEPRVAGERVAALARTGPGAVPITPQITLTNTRDSYVETIRPVLWAALAASALVLLIASVNVTVLTIVRSRRRERELAVRLALGASRIRVARLVALEGVLLGGAAAAVGLALASVMLPVIAPVAERALDRRVPGGLEAISLDPPVVLISLACVAAVTALLAGIPLLLVGHAHLSLVSSARGATDHRRATRARAVLIALEVAASLTLLVGAVLMVETARRMVRVDFGLEADGVVTTGLGTRLRSFPDVASQVALFERLGGALEAAHPDTPFAFGAYWPLQPPRPRRVEHSGADPVVVDASHFVVSANYFETLGIPVVSGRSFTRQDRIGADPVAIVSASLARRLWPGDTAIGQPATMHADDGRSFVVRVIGVVADTRQSHADTELLDAYVPLAQHGGRFVFLYVKQGRTPIGERPLQATIASVDREIAMSPLRPLAASIEQERVRPVFLAWFLTVLAVLASLLALVGMYGVIAFAVRQRQREVAVRVALGAGRREVTAMFLRHGATVLAAGLVAGTGGAIALGRVLESQLYGVQPAEPVALTAAIASFSLVGAIAMVWPAWKASGADPSVILKDE